MEPTKISLTLCKKDEILKQWKSRVILEGNGILSFLVKQAIIAFITKNEFVEIGRVYMDMVPDASDDYGKINVSIMDSQIIQTWISSLTQNNIKPSDAIKTILKNSIKEVSSKEEEYIPTYSNFSSYHMIEQLKKITQAMHKTGEDVGETTTQTELNTVVFDPPFNREANPINENPIDNPIENTSDKKNNITSNNGKKSLVRDWGLGPRR